MYRGQLSNTCLAVLKPVILLNRQHLQRRDRDRFPFLNRRATCLGALNRTATRALGRTLKLILNSFWYSMRGPSRRTSLKTNVFLKPMVRKG